MRVVIIRSNPVKPDSRVEKAVEALIRTGNEVCVLAWDRQANYSVRKETLSLSSADTDIFRIGVRADYGGGIRQNWLPLVLIQLKFILWLLQNRRTYDVIHACDFDTALVGFICGKLLKKQLVYDIFDYYVDSHRLPRLVAKVVEFLDHTIINAADAVIICSEERREQIGRARPRRLVVIHNSPDARQKLRNEGDRRLEIAPSPRARIAYVGILGNGRLLKELVECVSQRDDCELHIGGFGQLEPLIAEASERFSNIYWYGRLPYHLTLQLDALGDYHTANYAPSIPYQRNAAPTKYYEALLLGKPLIVAEKTGIDTVVRRENIGVVIPYSREGIDRGIDLLLDRRNEWVSMQQRMKKLYQDRYSWCIMEKRLSKLYEDIQLEQ